MMKKDDLSQGIQQILEIDETVTDHLPLTFDSLAVLAVIAFIDEHFGKQLKATDIRNVKTLHQLIDFIGPEHIAA